MKLFKFKNMAMIGALSVAGIGLVGIGVHATFTTSTESQQTITAGDLSVAVSAPGATCLASDAFGSCNSISLVSAGPEGSTFDDGPTIVTLSNEGTVVPYEISIAFGDTVGVTSADAALAAETYMCVTSDGYVLENGLLSTISGYGFSPYPLPHGTFPTNTDEYAVEYYAGAADNACGSAAPGAAIPASPAPNPAAGTSGLDNSAEGGVIDPSVTLQYIG